jgi:O-antigen ligase
MILRIAGTYVHLLELPLLFFLLCAVTVRSARRGFHLRVTNVALPFALFVSLALYLCAIALSAWNALEVGLVVKSGLKWAEVFLLVFLVFLYVETQKDFALIYWALALSCALPVGRTLVLVIAGKIPLLGYRVFPGPEALFALSLALPFLSEGRRWSTVFAGLCLLSAVLSMSRLVWVGLPLLFLFAHRHRLLPPRTLRLLLFSIAGMLVVVFLVDRSLLLYRWSELFAPRHVSNVERWTLLKTAFAFFLHHPLLGVGSLNFPRALRQQGLLPAIVAPDPDVLEPHNGFLQVLAEEGMLGFCFFSLALLVQFLLVRVSLRSSGVSLPYKLGLAGFMVAMVTYLLFGFISAQFRFFLALGYGLAAATARVMPSGYLVPKGTCNA